jgi:hypothetical protein
MEHNFEDPLAILLAQIVMIIPWPVFLAGFSKDQTANYYGEIIARCSWALIIGMYFP